MLDAKKYKVLLIEDDKLDQLAFERLVKDEKLSYDYIIVDSVEASQKILNNQSFDVIITDYSLQDGTAFDILEETKESPIIFTTGAGNEKLAVEAMKAGAYDYLIKNPSRSYLSILPLIIENAVNHAKMVKKVKAYHENLEDIVKERTEQLKQEKELLSVTLSSMTDGVIVVDQYKNVILLNNIAEKITGYTFENAKGKNINELLQFINELTKEPVENPIDKVLSTGQIQTMIEPGILIVTENEEYPVSISAAPFSKIKGTLSGVVVVIHDRSQEHVVDQMKTDFISSVSHELRTPLTSIKAYTETILRDPNMSEEQKREFLITVDSEANRLTDLVNSLLDISKLDSGQFEIVKQDIDIVDVVEKTILSLKCSADNKNITLDKTVTGEIPNLWGHDSRIKSLVTNLISNAIKFTPNDGKVSVSIEYSNEELILSVSDTGIGIPEKDISHIFDRFYRVPHSEKQTTGTGLGLAIVKEVATLHGGTVEVKSKLEEGTTFTVKLPLLEKIVYEPTDMISFN